MNNKSFLKHWYNDRLKTRTKHKTSLTLKWL